MFCSPVRALCVLLALNLAGSEGIPLDSTPWVGGPLTVPPKPKPRGTCVGWGMRSGWSEGDVEIGAVDPKAGPPVYQNPNKGQTKYPFAELVVHQVMYVRKPKGTVRDAAKRYMRLHKGVRLSIWRGADGRTVVKRVK